MPPTLAVRACAFCGGSMAGKKSHAVYCDRACKTKASDARRVLDGREQARNLARYPREAERRREDARRYLRENPERMRAVRRRRKMSSRIESKVFTERDWQRMVARFRGCCAYCGVYAGPALQREHVVPLVRGGRHSVGNILPACPRCNGSKKAKFITEWRYGRRRGGGR